MEYTRLRIWLITSVILASPLIFPVVGNSIRNLWRKLMTPMVKTPLRRAFLKYGLIQQVSQPGIYGNFKFEVLIECSRDDLTKNEYAKIEELQPEYNRMMCPPSADRMWPKIQNHEKCCYVQYHNYDVLGYLPYEGLYFRDLIEESSYVVSKKRECLKLKGENVYLIVGIKQQGRKKKDFFLWDYTQIEEVEVKDDDGEKEYGVSGSHFLCKKPVYLNDVPGFEHFAKHTMGSFAYGFQNAINDPFSNFLMDESHYTALKDMKMSTLDWLADFEEDTTDPCLWLTEKDENGKAFWNFFGLWEGKLSSSCCMYFRARNALFCEPEFFVEEFIKFHRNHSEIIDMRNPLTEASVKLAETLSFIPHKVTIDCPLSEVAEDWLVDVRKLLNMKHVEVYDVNGLVTEA